MGREMTVGCDESSARRISDRIAERLSAERGEKAEDVGSFCDALRDFMMNGGGDGQERCLRRLRECTHKLCESGVRIRELADAFAEAAESMDARFEGDVEVYRVTLRAQAEVVRIWELAERRKGEELEGRLEEIDAFPDTIAATLDPPTLAKMGLEKLKRITGAERAALFRYEERGIFISDDGVSTDLPGGRMVLRGDAERALMHEKKAYRGRDDEPAGVLLNGARMDTPGRLFLPLTVRGRTTGVIALDLGEGKAEDGRESLDSLRLAKRFAGRMAVALENAVLHEREQSKIRETVALLELARAINSTLDLEEILEKVARMSVDLCDVVECVVYLRDKEEGYFFPGARYGFLGEGGGEEGPRCLRPQELDGASLRALESGEPVYLEASRAWPVFDRLSLYGHGVDTVLIHPLSSRERLTGVIALLYPRPERKRPRREELGVIAAIAAQASMAIENAYLYEDIERSYYSTIRALARAIEVKDPYTHGHSERVTEYALIIADAMRLDERERQKLKYAATLHDIGKIGIAGRVLNKPGALTEEEYSHVKTHPLLGDSIIEPVEFLQEPRPIILHHHERYDGKGYPDGLKGENIPLCARILSVADAFEAMRSDRPYRRALPLEEALGELKRNAGTQFDPEVVKVFLSVLEGYGGDPVNRCEQRRDASTGTAYDVPRSGPCGVRPEDLR